MRLLHCPSPMHAKSNLTPPPPTPLFIQVVLEKAPSEHAEHSAGPVLDSDQNLALEPALAQPRQEVARIEAGLQKKRTLEAEERAPLLPEAEGTPVARKVCSQGL